MDTYSLLMSGRSAFSSIPPSERRCSEITFEAFISAALAPIMFAALGGSLGIAVLGLNVTFAPGCLAGAPRIDVRVEFVFDDGGMGRRLGVEALASFEEPMSLIVD